MSRPNLSADRAEAFKLYKKGVSMVSHCCGYGTYGDYLMCEKCKEHCSQEPEILFEDWLEEMIDEAESAMIGEGRD